MKGLASMTMYARPELVGAHDRLWTLIREHLTRAGVESPEQLSQDADEWFVWQHSDLVLSQTCGMPYRTVLHEMVELVGTPDYGLDDCPPGYYRSALVVRLADERTALAQYTDAVFAYNQANSQSGYAAPYWHLEPKGFWFTNRVQTDQHIRSAQLVAEGGADIASLDAVSWRLMQEHVGFAEDLRVLEWTDPTPGLPLITAKGNDAGLIFGAVRDAIQQLQLEDQLLLGLKGIVKIPAADYLSVNNPPEN